MSDPLNNPLQQLSLHDIIKHCAVYATHDYIWARRCLTDAIVSIWFREDRCPCISRFYMVAFRDENHARACCRGEDKFESRQLEMSMYQQHQEFVLSESDKRYTISVVLVSGTYSTLLRFARKSMAFWSSVDSMLSAKAVYDQKKFQKYWCNGCQKHSTNLKKCKNCKAAPYCSSECIKKDWKEHKTRCIKK